MTINLSQASSNQGGGNHGCQLISKKFTKENLWQYLIEYHRRDFFSNMNQDSLGQANKFSIDKVFRKKDPKRYI